MSSPNDYMPLDGYNQHHYYYNLSSMSSYDGGCSSMEESDHYQSNMTSFHYNMPIEKQPLIKNNCSSSSTHPVGVGNSSNSNHVSSIERNFLKLKTKKKQQRGINSRHHSNHFENDIYFTDFVHSTEMAIANQVLPERISHGSSGSYFAKNISGDTIGVFKPKDEEPYGKLNPKWIKWMHKHCCPSCCFGRSCLIPNQGYLSEAGAYLVDERLGPLNIVPRTRIVRLASETFNYNAVDRAKSHTKQRVAHRFPEIGRHFHRLGLPPKVGSFQLFMQGYRNADSWLRHYEDDIMNDEKMGLEFQVEFEKLVVLDYIIRNTDRGLDNWLIKHEKKDQSTESSAINDSEISIAAIDNGLAFPYKHPDEWRTYPFLWCRLAMAQRPFSDNIKQLVEEKVNNMDFVENLVCDIYHLFKTDKGFDREIFECQMAVMRGQMLNLSAAFKSNKSPSELVQMPVVTLERHHRRKYRNIMLGRVSENDGDDELNSADDLFVNNENSNSYVPKYYKRAFFSWC